jgi:hypothetical protein
MVFNVTFNNISVISWRSVLLVEDPEKTTDLFILKRTSPVLHRYLNANTPNGIVPLVLYIKSNPSRWWPYGCQLLSRTLPWRSNFWHVTTKMVTTAKIVPYSNVFMIVKSVFVIKALRGLKTSIWFTNVTNFIFAISI